MNTKEKRLTELFKDTSFADYDYEEFDNANELIDSFQDRIREEEIIYYSNAIKYLAENDVSLHESLGLASEYGYTTENLSSEILATILYQQNLIEELSELTSEIEEIFDNEEE